MPPARRRPTRTVCRCGCRTRAGNASPLHDPTRRGVLVDLDLTHDAVAVRRAAFEASGFVARRMIDAAVEHADLDARRIVATGGGIRVDEWVQALADCTGLPVDCVAVPEGGALGSAFLGRIAAGLEPRPRCPTAGDGRGWAAPSSPTRRGSGRWPSATNASSPSPDAITAVT